MATGQSAVCKLPRCCSPPVSPLAHYISSPLSLTEQGCFCRIKVSVWTRQGPQSLSGSRSHQNWEGLCICSGILGWSPLERRCRALLFHFPGADGVLKLRMQCPSFPALTVSVERMLRLRESGIKPTENEASRCRTASAHWECTSVCPSPVCCEQAATCLSPVMVPTLWLPEAPNQFFCVPSSRL